MKKTIELLAGMFTGFITFVWNVFVFSMLLAATMLFFPFIVIAALPFLIVGGVILAMILAIAVAIVIGLAKIVLFFGVIYILIVIIGKVTEKMEGHSSVR